MAGLIFIWCKGSYWNQWTRLPQGAAPAVTDSPQGLLLSSVSSESSFEHSALPCYFKQTPLSPSAAQTSVLPAMYFSQCWQINSLKSWINVDSQLKPFVSLPIFSQTLPICVFSVVCTRCLILLISLLFFEIFFTNCRALNQLLDYFSYNSPNLRGSLQRLYFQVIKGSYYMVILWRSCYREWVCCPNSLLHLIGKLILI